MRCFIAVDTVTPRLVNVANQIKELLVSHRVKASYQNPNTLHITIKFLGEIPDNMLDDIVEVLKRIHIRKFSINIRGLGGFPNLRAPRVLFFNVIETNELNELFRFIERELVKLGFPRETREFKPHITIARIKSRLGFTTKLYESLKNIDIREEILIGDIKLKESILYPHGAVYRDIFVHELR